MSDAVRLRDAVQIAIDEAPLGPEIPWETEAEHCLRAIVDELGLTWEMVDGLREVRWFRPDGGVDEDKDAYAAADAIATLLEVAGVER